MPGSTSWGGPSPRSSTPRVGCTGVATRKGETGRLQPATIDAVTDDATDFAHLAIARLTLDDIDALVDHMVRQVAESGRDGSPIFNPFGRDHHWDPAEMEERRRLRWETDLREPGWGRCFGAWEGARIVGHVEIDGGSIAANQHRALLMMGIERAYHGRGLGSRLIEAAVRWCRDATDLAWIDLGVFGHNSAARALYRKAGFVEIGTTRDRFRVDGRSIDDIHMVLALR